MNLCTIDFRFEKESPSRDLSCLCLGTTKKISKNIP